MFVADQEREKETRFVPDKKAHFDNNVAVSGSGPTGLFCACYLAVDGFQVTVFEKSEKPGGMLMMGIPSFRLEKDVNESEIERCGSWGSYFVAVLRLERMSALPPFANRDMKPSI